VRHAILQSWSRSSFLTLRNLAKTIASLAQKATAASSPVFHRTVGYTDVPPDWKQVDGYNFSFLQVPQGSDTHIIETDVVIVGSGCGGAVAAKNIAEAGHRVLVVDKANYFPPSHFPMAQGPGLHHLFDNGGAYITESGASILAGSAWGGGGTVNWSVCLRPQDFVRKEWAAAGLPFFQSPEFDECLDRVWEFVGASTDNLRHNHGNNVLLQGSRKLGIAVREAAQNTGGKGHYCGQCHLGCGSAGKRGPAVSWLPEAGKAGAQFMEGLQVEKVLFGGADGKTAIGVEGDWTPRSPQGNKNHLQDHPETPPRRVRIQAKRVVISAGSLWSPVVLMNSDIQVSETPLANFAHSLILTTIMAEPSSWTELAHSPMQPSHSYIWRGHSAVGRWHHHQLQSGV
jgi:choline dehydrogenase-like flavoprotein